MQICQAHTLRLKPLNKHNTALALQIPELKHSHVGKRLHTQPSHPNQHWVNLKGFI